MMRSAVTLVSLLLTVGLSTAIQAAETSAKAQVIALLTSQVRAWNKGDLNAFMKGYWQSPETEYVGASGIVQGWKAIQERYQRDYQATNLMGHLRFEDLHVTVLAPDAALAVGEYVLQSGSNGSNPGRGIFTLVLRRFPEGWRIINDHTSALAARH
ncbi:MAG: YybH family protein [Terriglobia bacterium]